jgi:alcohol dehydrogenase
MTEANLMERTMKACVVEESDIIYLKDVPIPEIIESTDVIAKVTLATICTTDIDILHGWGAFPLIAGHEFCAMVVEAGPEVKKLKPGDRCLCLPAVYCGECPTCQQGSLSMCEKYSGLGGGANNMGGAFAEYIRIPLADRHMIPIPEGLTEEDVIFAGDVMITARFALTRAGIKEGQSVAVFGVGPIGLAACLLSKKVYKAKTVIAVDLLQYRLDLALEKGIADFVVNAAEGDPVERIKAITGVGVDVAIETAGCQETIANSISSVKINGVVSSLAVLLEPIEINWFEMLMKNLTIKAGLQCLEGAEEMMQRIKAGELDVRWMATHKAPLNDILRGYQIFGNHEENCIKWLVTPYER